MPQFVQNLHSGRRLDPQLVHAVSPLPCAVVNFVLLAGVMVVAVDVSSAAIVADTLADTVAVAATGVATVVATGVATVVATGVATVAAAAVAVVAATSATAGTASRNSPTSSAASTPLRISKDGAGALP